MLCTPPPPPVPMAVSLRWMWDASGSALALPFWRTVVEKLVLPWVHSIGLDEDALKVRGMVVSAMLCRVPHCRSAVSKALAEAATGFSDRYLQVCVCRASGDRA